jgi:hypothetical protein
VELTEATAAAAAAPAGSDSWARAMDDLAEAHADAGDLSQAIQVRIDAIAALAPGLDPEISRELASSLGVDLMSRYRRVGGEQDLHAAVVLGEAALAGVHMRLWTRDLDRPRLEAGVRRVRAALDMIPDPDRKQSTSPG